MKSLIGYVIVCFVFVVRTPAQGPLESEAIDYRFIPQTKESKGLVLILLGGSEGGFPEYYDTTTLTDAGYDCAVVAYFGTANTPKQLELIPLEYFEAIFRSLRAKPEVGNKKFVVWGGSKGGELALLLASRYREIEGVIAAVPSAVVFQGIGGKPTSSWSFEGAPIPFVPYAPYDWSTIVNSQYRGAYEESLKQSEEVMKAAIKVENINGPVLLLTAKADSMWPSSEMGDMIETRLSATNFPHKFLHVAYEDAGHTLNDSYIMGGTTEGNKKAATDSKRQTMEFLKSLAKSEIHP